MQSVTIRRYYIVVWKICCMEVMLSVSERERESKKRVKFFFAKMKAFELFMLVRVLQRREKKERVFSLT